MDTFKLIFGGGFLLAGIALVIWGISQFRSAKQKAQTWLTCTGTVTNTGLDARSSHDADGSSSTNYLPQVFYQYPVNGVMYSGNRIGFGNVSYDYGTASRKIAAYSPGAQVMVYYDPADPAQSVLEMKAQTGGILLTLGIVFSVVGILALIFLPAMRK